MKKAIASIFVSLLFLLILFVYQNRHANDGKLHVVFCAVGQGDSIFIRTPKGKVVLIDGGPDESVLDCLSRHTPFWERKVDLMILSHPHTDHFAGLISVLKRYTVLSFATENLQNKKAAGILSLRQELERHRTPQRFLYAKDSFKTDDGVTMRVIGPSSSFLKLTSPGGEIGETKEFGSVETVLSYGNFSVLFTGDSQVAELKESISSGLLQRVSVLQVPHHGSRFGLDEEVVRAIKPQVAAISVGKNNYGHPSPEVLELLGRFGVKFLRTDQHGDIEITSDGKEWEVK